MTKNQKPKTKKPKTKNDTNDLNKQSDVNDQK